MIPFGESLRLADSRFSENFLHEKMPPSLPILDFPMRHHPLKRDGFTLVELLTVMAVISLIAVLSLPAVNTILRGSLLTQGAQMINDQLGLARQTALSKNRSVEVRFYQFGDPEAPGEIPATPSSGKYRAMQLFEMQDSGAAVAMGKALRLPQSIILDSSTGGGPGATLSSLLDIGTTPSLKKVWSALDLQVSVPRVNGTNYNCCAFRFLPDGSTNLSPFSPPGPWFLTLRSLTDVKSPPANFFTIQIDATNGHIKTFRP